MCQFVPNLLSYVSAKYYLNWFTAGKVTTTTMLLFTVVFAVVVVVVAAAADDDAKW